MCALFTESAANDPIFKEILNYLVVVPKTIKPTESLINIDFDDREGICLGDATKLSNTKIIGENSYHWIEAIHRRLPHVNLYAYKQYSGQNPLHPKISFIPHMTDDFGNWLSNRRLFICLNVHLTFEMVACEAQSYGTPVVYRHMPHSLSEYISATGLAVRTPDEMGEMVAWLYNSKKSWKNFSRSSKLNSESKHIELLKSPLEGYLRLAIFRIQNLAKVR
jgi:glycosyltransferase involved in cell wall biosynthesis